MSEWEVIVGNVGTVFRGSNSFNARQEFYSARRASMAPHGRASGESVTLMRDGEIVEEYAPRDPVDEVFREYGNNATARDFREAARIILDSRRAEISRRAALLREKRAEMRRLASAHGIAQSAPLLATLSHKMREEHGRVAYTLNAPRANEAGLLREIAEYEAAAAWRRSDAHARRMNSLPCGLQDADGSRAFEDAQMLRLARIMLRLVRKESK